MAFYHLETVKEYRSELGESPVWDGKNHTLYWVDGLGKRIFAMDAETRFTTEFVMAEMIGCIIPTKSGMIIAGMEDGVYEISLIDKSFRLLAHPAKGSPYLRYNEGKADPMGRIVIGTISESGEGELYIINKDKSSECIRKRISISNGLAWDTKNGKMYYTDSPTQSIFQYQFDSRTGKLSGERICIRIARSDGMPDGMTIDEEGMLWIAHWGGYKVSRWNPETGECIGEIKIPVRNVTSCTFGGRDLDELYITTSASEVVGTRWEKEPQAGALFMVKPGVKGMLPFLFDR